MTDSIIATSWGLVSGMALLIGALIGYFVPLKSSITASIMAYGSGVLISVLAFDLMDEAFQKGGILASTIGFLIGAIIYTAANEILAKYGARHRKRSKNMQATNADEGSGSAIALGALLDGIPESMAIGLSMLAGEGVSLVAVIGIFLSNLPEGLSSATGMKKAGRSRRYIFGLWAGIALVSAASAWSGYALFGNISIQMQAATTAIAAGAILAMIVDTMIPEAYQETRMASGLITVLGFLTAFILTKTLDN